MDVAMVGRLATGEGWGLLESLPPYDAATVLALQDRLRAAGFDADLVAAALTQSRLRARAVDKFGAFAAGMLFTDDGLEQATRLPLAARHAERFVRAGVATVHDLGCGIGADAMAFAGLDLAVQAVDADPVTAAVAAVNLRHFPEATVRAALAESVTLPAGPGVRHTGVWVDPARRLTGVADSRGRTKRVFSLDAISPSWAHVQRWAGQVPAAGAKLSPAFAHHALPAGTEGEWVSWEGDVLECVVWFGSLARRPGRVASVCRRDRLPVSVSEADALGGDARVGRLSEVGPYLYEADRAVLRAGLTGALVRVLDGTVLDTGVGYVSADRLVDVGYARRFAVLEAMPLNVKSLRAWARSRGIGRLTIKKRGVSLDADLLRRQLRLSGDASATVVLTRVAGGQVAVVVEPR